MNEMEVIERLTKVEVKTEQNINDIKDVKANTQILTELVTAVKLSNQSIGDIKNTVLDIKISQEKTNEKIEKTNEKLEETNNKINEKLEETNNKIDTEISKVKDDQGKLCEKINTVSVQEDVKKGKKWDIFWNKIGIKAVEVIVTLILGGIVGAGIAYIANK